MDIIDPAIDSYLAALTPRRNETFAAMEAYAKEADFPIVGPLVGRFLYQLVKMVNVRRAFELGSGYGYSAIWMASAMDAGGRVVCTERSEENISRGKAYAETAQVADYLMWHQGDALEILPAHDGLFDLIFIDAGKAQYPRALELSWPRIRRGGVLLADNVLWSGQVVDPNATDEETRGILRFNNLAYALPDAMTSIIPLRDGVLLALKM